MTKSESNQYKHRPGRKFKPKYSRQSDSSPITLKRKYFRSPRLKTIEIGKYKRILIMCPACNEVYVLQGKQRSVYLKKLQQKGYKFGRPCSPECAKNLRNPAFRRQNQLINVSNNVRDLTNAPKPPKRKAKKPEEPQYVEPIHLKKLKEGAAID